MTLSDFIRHATPDFCYLTPWEIFTLAEDQFPDTEYDTFKALFYKIQSQEHVYVRRPRNGARHETEPPVVYRSEYMRIRKEPLPVSRYKEKR